MRLFLAIALFFSAPSAFAFKIDAKKIARSMAWNQLIDKVIAEGNVSETGVSQIRSLSKVEEIEKGQSRVAYYLEVAGTMTMFGEFIVEQSALTKETWTLKEDGKVWVVDQWFYYMTPKGEFRYADHRVVEKEGVTIHSLKDAPKGTVEEQKAELTRLLDMWLLQ